MAKKKTVKLTPKAIDKLPDDKPVNYKIFTAGNKINYAGVAKKGRVQERMKEHLPGGKDYIPGVKVQITQAKSIGDAKKQEKKIIAKEQPKYNKQGKVKDTVEPPKK